MKLYCLFIDYRKVFYGVWREGLWRKLVIDNVNGKLLKVVDSMYTIIKSCVMVNQEISDTSMHNTGVRQGEHLSSLLFALFVNDTQEKLIEHNYKFLDFDNDLLNSYLCLLVLMYAYDTVLLCGNESNMRQRLLQLSICIVLNGSYKFTVVRLKLLYSSEVK